MIKSDALVSDMTSDEISQLKIEWTCSNDDILHEPSLDKIIKIQEEPNCLYVSQSVNWLTSLLKLGQ